MSHRIRIAAVLVAVGALSALAPPAHALRGDPADWTWNNPAMPMRWDPCTTITWSTPHDGGATDRAFSKAIRKVARFSGFTFQRVESGGMIQSNIKQAAEIGNYGAVTAPTAFMRDDGNYWNESAWITVSAEMMAPEWVEYLPSIFLHEMGHVMGLGHVPADDEVMNSGQRPNRFGAGDRAGLAATHSPTCAPPSLLTMPPNLRGEIHRMRKVVA